MTERHYYKQMIDKIILASSSLQRKQIFEMLGIPFEIIPSDADEKISIDIDPEEYVCELSKRKGIQVAEKCKNSGADMTRTLIVACDTVVVYDGLIIGKPKDEAHAILTLEMLSDSWHAVFSGVTLIYGDKTITDFSATDVKFFELDEKDIMEYVESGEPMGKAGSYAIQKVGAAFVEKIEGDYYNIVGFPVSLFIRMLKEFGTNIFELRKLHKYAPR